MAEYGKLGTPRDLLALAPQVVYTCPADTFAVVSINIVNRNTASSARIKVALSDTSSPTNAEWIEHDSELLEYGVIERTGIVVGAGQNIVVESSAANVTAMVYGIETSTL